MSKITDKYNVSKKAKVGSTCICPSCGSSFIKTNYQQAFCKNRKGTICKDAYWNKVDPKKRCNTTRISPASNRFMALRNDSLYSSQSRKQYNPDDDEHPFSSEALGQW